MGVRNPGRWLTAVLVLTVAACAQTPAAVPPPPSVAASPSPPPSASPSLPLPSSPSVTAPSPSRRAEGVELARSGGFTGESVTITVRPDGTWQRDGRKGKLAAATMAELQELIADPRLMTEADRKPATAGRCNDTYTYVLVVKFQLIHYDQCPGNGDKPAATIAIINLVEGSTRG